MEAPDLSAHEILVIANFVSGRTKFEIAKNAAELTLELLRLKPESERVTP